jgi:hypothetical protein
VAKYITINSVQASANLPDQPPLQALASGANGQFAKITVNASNALDGVYQSLGSQRVYYTVSYSSPSNSSGDRIITVGVPDKPAAGIAGQYQVKIGTPLLTLSAQSTQLRREPIPGAAAGQNPYGPLSVRAQVNIGWTDGITRGLQRIELDVNGIKKDEKTGAQLPPGTTSVDMVADLSDITNPGTNNATLRAIAVDALGNQASAEQRVTVQVAPLPTPTPVPQPGLSLDNPLVLIVVALLLVAAILVLVIVVLLLRRRGQARGHAGKLPPSALPPDVPPLATIIVLKGPSAMVNQPIYLTRPRVVLGRDPTATDVTFYAGEQSSVSRTHAVLEYDNAAGFSIMDKASANGTSLNGRKLNANLPEPVHDGDEVVLGDLSKRGVRLRFALGKGSRWVGGLDDKTQIGL